VTRALVSCLAVLFLSSAPLCGLAQAGQGGGSPLDGWDFRLKEFVIGAWLGPDGTDAEIRVYEEAGFNVVMVGRYMSRGGVYADPDSVARELDLAHKHGLWAMLDTYTRDNKPWGGVIPAGADTGHHNATLEEIRSIHERFGKHPALAGYMLGDDQGQMAGRLGETTAYLHENAPDMIPWVCGWVSAADLATHGNPFVNWQIYPTLYNTGEPAEVQARQYCDAFDNMRKQCEECGTVPWPMINADGDDVSDSTLRFPLYAPLAYGAQGLWYFTYRNSMTYGKEGEAGYDDYEQALRNVTKLYRVGKTANWRIREWGPELLGRTSTARFSTGWAAPSAEDPGPGKLVASMDPDVLVGILEKPGEPKLALVVDKRVSKEFGATKPRALTVTFGDGVHELEIVGNGDGQEVQGRTARLTLAGGEGALLKLR